MDAPRRTGAPALRVVVIIAFAALLGGGACGGSSGPSLTAEQLQDPQTCNTCHPDQFAAWSLSMHAYSSDDPVFRAMNKRAQNDPGGPAGDLCVKCHAPVAQRQGLTTDGLNLDQLPQRVKGVTCYFCHSVESVAGDHNDPLVLAQGGTLFGPFTNPAPGAPHPAKYSTLFDETSTDSADMCGSCHDIVNLHQAHVERTFSEWKATLFSQPKVGLSCASSCHMNGTQGAASTVSTSVIRTLHNHAFPGVDQSLTPSFADPAAQQPPAQALLDTALQTTMCFDQGTNQVRVILDNVGAGHGFPSGATPDRRAWVELTAYAGDNVIYSSGGAAAAPLEASPDPDLWLIRDCLQDDSGAEVKMFWQASSVDGNNLPGSVMQVVSDPTSYSRTHLLKAYPSAAGGFSQPPDRITMKVHLQAIGDDVLADLASNNDLDPSLPAQIARYEVAGGALEWTPATAKMYMDPMMGNQLLPCVTNNLSLGRLPMTVVAVSHATCTPAP